MKTRLVARALTAALYMLVATFFSQCVSPDLNTGVNGSESTSFGAADWPAKRAKVQPVAINNIQVTGYLGKRIDRNLESLMVGLESPIPKVLEAAAKEIP